MSNFAHIYLVTGTVTGGAGGNGAVILIWRKDINYEKSMG